MISRSDVSQDLQDFDEIVADLTHQWSDSEPEVDTVGINVKIVMVRIENASFGYDLIIMKLGALILLMRGGAKHSPPGDLTRTPEIHQKSSKINDLDNEPGHAWRLPTVSRATRDNI